jgi:hypothetical protein
MIIRGLPVRSDICMLSKLAPEATWKGYDYSGLWLLGRLLSRVIERDYLSIL